MIRRLTQEYVFHELVWADPFGVRIELYTSFQILTYLCAPNKSEFQLQIKSITFNFRNSLSSQIKY